ncbi:MAG: hypothetical protein LK562_11215, partial [Candidatus Accumulibacter phosphatis]|nr:hypothetical protein [Candidatus Accumulibacter phosphatis]
MSDATAGRYLGAKGAVLERREALADDDLGFRNILVVVQRHSQLDVPGNGLAVVAEDVVQLVVGFQVSGVRERDNVACGNTHDDLRCST